MGSSDIPVCAMQIAITFGRFLALKSVNSPIYYIYLNILCPTDKNVCATTDKKNLPKLVCFGRSGRYFRDSLRWL